MNIEEALRLSIELWTWLYENPSKNKYDWPRYEEEMLHEMQAGCPLCHVCESCDVCPINMCMKHGYGRWLYGQRNQITKESQEGSRKLLKKLQEALKNESSSISQH